MSLQKTITKCRLGEKRFSLYIKVPRKKVYKMQQNTLPVQGITWSSSRAYSTRVRYHKLGISYSNLLIIATILNPTTFKPKKHQHYTN